MRWRRRLLAFRALDGWGQMRSADCSVQSPKVSTRASLKRCAPFRLQGSDREDHEDLGLNRDEIAFYDALAERPEVLEQMGDETLKNGRDNRKAPLQHDGGLASPRKRPCEYAAHDQAASP
jgi:Domain of unknown function (DUF3387)